MSDKWEAHKGRESQQIRSLRQGRNVSLDGRVVQAVPVKEFSRQKQARLGITVYVQPDEPLEAEVGDLWFDTDEPVG